MAMIQHTPETPLKPCPFCGSPAVAGVWEIPTKAAVCCRGCTAEVVGTRVENTIIAWNRRTISQECRSRLSAQDATIARLREVCKLVLYRGDSVQRSDQYMTEVLLSCKRALEMQDQEKGEAETCIG